MCNTVLLGIYPPRPLKLSILLNSIIVNLSISRNTQVLLEVAFFKKQLLDNTQQRPGG